MAERNVPGDFDITCSFDGVPPEKLWGERVAGCIGEAAVFFPSKDCLILNKRAAGRPKDLRDIEALQGP